MRNSGPRRRRFVASTGPATGQSRRRLRIRLTPATRVLLCTRFKKFQGRSEPLHDLVIYDKASSTEVAINPKEWKMSTSTEKFDHLFVAPKDFDQSLKFYRDMLGWSVAHSWGGNGEQRGAMITNGGGMTVVVAEQHSDNVDHAWRSGINGHRPTVHLLTEDVDKRFADLGPSHHVVVEPEDTHWGVRWFVVRDPDDNLIAFFQPLSDH